MTYSVYQHWDPLKVCIVGRSYSPEFYHFIKNDRARNVMERIARETEEDYQKLITLLESFGVKILRPEVSDNYLDYLDLVTNRIQPPPMTPRDYTMMLGDTFFFKSNDYRLEWHNERGHDWPEFIPSSYDEFLKCADHVKPDVARFLRTRNILPEFCTDMWANVLRDISQHSKIVVQESALVSNFNSALTTRIGKDIYVGTEYYAADITDQVDNLRKVFPEYRWHKVDTGGHSDGVFCPVVPGLIVSLRDIKNYQETFPGWEVVYLPWQSWAKVYPFLQLKDKNGGKWWVPGEELNDDFTSFVEEWLGHWVGYVEETVFDVNMLVIDRHNVVCNN